MHKQFVDQYGEIHERDLDQHEELDPTPVSIPLRFQRAHNLNEVVRQMVRSEELRRLADMAGHETFDEADDFNIDDEEMDPSSPYEEIFEGDVLRDNFARDQLARKAAEQSPSKGDGQEKPPSGEAPPPEK